METWKKVIFVNLIKVRLPKWRGKWEEILTLCKIDLDKVRRKFLKQNL